MKKYVAALLFLISGITTYGQEYSSKAITVGEYTFLPYLKGKVINRISRSDITSLKIFTVLQSQPDVGTPQGYEVEAYSDGNSRFLDINFMPYVLVKGETIRSPGSRINLYFNDISLILGQPLQNGIGDIYTAPVKTGYFMDYPIYEHEGRETTVIYKGDEPLFLPVSQEEYLTALIKAEEKKQKDNGITASKDENLVEIEKVYQELLRIDKTAAEEFKKEMESYQKDLDQNNSTEVLVTSYKKELALLSPSERKKQAFYALYAMERNGNFSGLLPQNEIGSQPLVKPNYKAVPKATSNLRLIVLEWKLSNNEHPYSPRSYQPINKVGYELTDDKIYELYHNEPIWKRVIEEVE